MKLLRIMKGKKRFPLTKLTIKSVHDYSTEKAEIFQLFLTNPITKTGSRVDTPITLSADSVYVIKKDMDRIRFCKKKGHIVQCKTDLSFDVSSGRGRVVDGVWTIMRPPKIWLTNRLFINMGYVSTHADKMRQTLNDLFKPNEG